MRKLAVFVEGYTEFYFVHRLINEIAGYGKVRFELTQHIGGRLVNLKTEGAPDDIAEMSVMLCNCCGDGKVKSAILERAPLLKNQGYETVIGLKDLYPMQLHELGKVEAGVASNLSFPGLEIRIFIAVAEIEAWFLNEYSHYERLNPALTRQVISSQAGFDPVTSSAELEIRHPAGKLKFIYALAGETYDKKQSGMHRMLSLLDFDTLYSEVRPMSNSFDEFVAGIERFMDIPTPVAS